MNNAYESSSIYSFLEVFYQRRRSWTNQRQGARTQLKCLRKVFSLKTMIGPRAPTLIKYLQKLYIS